MSCFSVKGFDPVRVRDLLRKEQKLMKTSVKNFIAKILVLCLLVGMIPAFALEARAASDNPYSTSPDTATPAEVKSEAKTENGAAKAEVTEANMTAAIANAVANAETENKKPAVDVKVETAADATSLKVDLPAESLKDLAKQEWSLAVTSGIASIELDNAALGALVGQATGGTITLDVAPAKEEDMSEAQTTALAKAEDTPAVYDLSLLSDGEAISSFTQGDTKGKLSISLPYELPAGKTNDDVRVYYMNDKGVFERHRDASLGTDGKVKFSTTHLSTYVITTSQLIQEFIDVVTNSWYDIGVVDWSAANGVITGRGQANLFAPTVEISRAELATMLFRLDGEHKAAVSNPFTDVSADDWFYDAALWAYSKGIVTGYGSSDTFAPSVVCTRAEIVTFLWRYYDKQIVSGSNSFTDLTQDWYKDAVNWAVKNGISDGIDAAGTLFAPAAGCDRIQAATFLYRAEDK